MSFTCKLFLLVFIFAVPSGCDTQGQQNDFVDDAELPASGYTATDPLGNVLSEDRDDWRTAPIYLGKIRIDPAYPNPSIGQFVNIPISILEFNSIQGGVVLRAADDNGSLRLLDEILNASQPGSYTLRFTPALIGQTGLIRLFLFDRLGELISYGDLRIN